MPTKLCYNYDYNYYFFLAGYRRSPLNAISITITITFSWLVVVLEERLLESPLNVITITFTRGSINKQQWARLSGKYEPR